MAEKKSWRDYSKYNSTGESTSSGKTGSWRDYSKLNSESSGGQTNDWRSYATVSTESVVGENIAKRVNKYLNSHNSYISDYQKRYEGRKGDATDSYVSDSADWLEQSLQRKSGLNKEADAILSYIDQYKDYLDDKWVQEIRQSIESTKSVQKKLHSTAKNDNEYWSSFGANEELVSKYGSAEGVYNYYQKDAKYRKQYGGMTYSEVLDFLADTEAGAADGTSVALPEEDKEWLKNYAESVKTSEDWDNEISTYEGELASLEALLEEYRNHEKAVKVLATSSPEYQYASNRIYEISAQFDYEGRSGIETEITKKKTLINQAKDAKKLNELYSVQNNDDFEEYAAIGAAIENPTFDDAEVDGRFLWWEWGGSDIGNIVTYSRDNADKIAIAYGNGVSTKGNYLYRHMSNVDVKVYNYLLAKEGTEKANEFLAYLEPQLKSTEGKRMADLITGINIPGLEDIAVLGYGLGAGVDNWASGTKAFFTGEEIDPSVTQYANEYIGESLKGHFGQYAHQAATTVGNMAPSILVSSVTGGLGASAAVAQGLGAATVGISAAGNANSWALSQGYDPASARFYSTLVGISEGTLQNLIGGISSLGGVSGKLAGKVAAIDKAFLRTAARLGVSIGGEIAEEELQNYLEPAFRTIIFGEDYDAPTINELIETAIVTALSTGALEGRKTIKTGIVEQALKAEYGGRPDALIQEGLESDINTDSYKFATEYKAKTDGGKNLTGAEIRQLLEANQEQYTAKDLKLIQKAAETRLTELGVTEDVSKIAELATKYATDQKLTREEKSFLANSEYGSKVASQLNPDSVLKGEADTEWASDIGTRKVNKEAYNKKRFDTIKSTAEQRLTKLGLTENVAQMAELAAKYATGQELTRAEKKLLSNNEHGSSVASLLRAVNSVSRDSTALNTVLEEIANLDDPATYKPLEDRVAEGDKLSVSESGTATFNGEEINLSKPEVVDFVRDKNTGKVTDMILNVDGKEVKASEIEYANDDQSYLYSAVKNIENITPGDATAIIRDYDPSSGLSVGEYLNGIDEAYTYGYHNYSEADMGAGIFTSKLSSEQAKSAYLLGQTARNKSDADADAPVVRMRTAIEAETATEQKTATQKARIESDETDVYFMDGKSVVKFDEHTVEYDDKRMAGVNTAKFLSKLGIGGKYFFYESYVNADGVRVYKDADGNEVEAPNGIYKDSDGSIYIDLNAGDNGQGTTLFTLGHELLHFIKSQSKKQFKTLCELVEEAYSKTDMSMHERVLTKQKFLAEKRGKDVSYTEAYEEVVADAMSTMLSDGSFYDKLMEIKVKDKGLFDTIKRFFKKMIAKFTKAYEELSPDQKDAQDIRQMKDMFDKIQTAFAEALVEASDNFQAAQNSTKAIENSDGTVYSKRRYAKVFFKENVFPPFNESQSDSHEVAERWARSKEGRIEKKALLSHHNEWYVIQVFDDMKYGYQIIQKLSAAEYAREEKFYGTITGYQPLQNTLSRVDVWDYRRDSDENAGHRVDNDAFEHRKKDNAIHGLGENEVRWRKAESNKIGDNRGSSSDWGRRNEPSVKTLRLDELSARAKWLRKQLKRDGVSKAKKTEYRSELRDVQNEMDKLMQGYYPSRESKSKHSDRDSMGNKLSKEQQEYFKDSKAVDKDGNLQIVYHGTRNADFTVFKRNATYFTDNKEMADSYSPNGDMYEGYVNITNPYEIDARGEKWSKIPIDDATKKFLQDYGSSVFKEDGKWRTSPADIASAIEEAVDNGDMDYDGIIIKNIDDTGNYYKDKSSHLATDYIVFNSNQFKNVDNKTPTSDPDIRYSERGKAADQTDIYTRVLDLQQEVGNLQRSVRELEQSAECKTVHDKLSEAVQNGNVEEGIKQYQEWRESSGYAELVDKRDALRVELEKLTEERDNLIAKDGAEAEKAAIAKSGLSEADYFRKQAEKEFGYTPYFYDAGYITPNGKMLNFSGEKGKHFGSRGEDHRAIGIIYENTQGSDAMVRFMNDGNIRIMAETPGLDISALVEPTKEQYAQIRKFARENGSREKYFAVDISDENGRVIGNYEYDGYVNADRVVNDIKYFFENGNVREQSTVSRFLNSERGEGSSNRDLLANAFEGISKSSVEYELIQEYKGRIKMLNEYEEKLSQLNSEIRKMLFDTDTERDAKKLKELQAEAKKVSENINRNDKKLLSLEASEPLRKVIERERKKEAQKTKAHVKEIQQNKRLRADQTELRHKIRKAIRDLDKILNRGNKKLNVKEDMQNVVSTALKAADILFTDNYGTYDMLRNGIGTDLSDSEEALVQTCTDMLKAMDKMPTDGYESWQARQEAESRLRTKMSKLKDVFARERKRLNNTTVSSILGELTDAYASLEKSEQSYVQGAYSEPVHNYLKSLQSEVGGTIVMDMTKEQLESVYVAYKMVLNTVRNANKMFNEELKQSREQLGNAVIDEVFRAGGVHLLGTKLGDAISQFDWNNMKPIWLANRIGSNTFGKLMNGLFKGQYNFAVDINEVKQFKLSMDEKYNPRKWDAKKQYEFESSTGKKFSLDLQQIMSLYAFSKREQAYSHLLNGGFVFEDNSTVVVDGKLGIKKTYIHKGATSYKLNDTTLNNIISSLTTEQKAYVDEMQKYLSDVMGAKGNDVSMKLYGIQMFKEQFYFPLKSSGAYMERAKEAEMKKQQGQINLVNSGFTHSVKPEAKNPIILSGFMDVWAEHCNEMSMYHSMVLPMEDFRKVYNYSTIHDEKMESASVFQTIQDAYGKEATSYIDQLYRELNSGATVDPRETPYKKLISNFKKAAVMLSGSVVVQQFSSIGRAYAVIDPKYFVGAKVKSDTNLSVVEEMKKYAPVAIIKEMGGFDTGTKGSAKSYIIEEKYGKGERIKGLFTDEQYRGDLMGFLPQWADEKTWCAIWEATKRETKAKNPQMDVKSEEFLKLAGDRFSEIIEKTQVYDSVLARSANMRSKSGLMQMATAFMAEPTATVNLIEDAIRSGKAKNIARAFGAVAVSVVLNNALASIVYAMRDDDDDETFLEKYFQSFTSGMIDDINPMSYYPFLKDVYSLFQGYDVERADMSVIADIRDALKKTVNLLGKDTSEMNDDELAEHYKQVNEVFMGLLDAGCSAFGVPVKNVRRDVNGIINAWQTVSEDISGERNTTWNSFWDKVGAAAKDTIPIYAWTKDKPKADKLYDAIISGDKAYLARIKSGYKTDDAYQSAVRKALRENDSRIHDAAQAKYDGNTNEYKRIFREIQKEGNFSFDDIMSAINSEENAIKNKVEPEKATSSYSASEFVESIVLGDSKTAQAMKEDIISTKVANGKTQDEAEKEFTSSVSTGIRDAYSSGLLDEAGAEKMLVKYADKDEEEAASKVSYWAFCEEHPEHDFSESNVNKYKEFAEPENISLDVYAQFIEGTKDLTEIKDKWGDVEVTKREQVLEVIDSLPLTWQQKDALYLAAGYSENKIWDVPW